MKKISVICLVMVLLCTMLAGVVYAEEATWHCETCDADRDTAFCPVCGAKRPEAEPETEPEAEAPGTWICPTCGKEISTEFSFCPDDGTRVSVWPHRELTGSSVKLRLYPGYYRRKEPNRQAYLGPDKSKYPGGGSYKPSTFPVSDAYFQEGKYVYVDIPGKLRKCVYFTDDSLANVPETVERVTLEGIPAIVVKEAIPHLGPGLEYEELIITEKAKTTSISWDGGSSYFPAGQYPDDFSVSRTGPTYTVVLPSDTKILVYFEFKNWVFAEMNTAVGPVRAWLPEDTVAPAGK